MTGTASPTGTAAFPGATKPYEPAGSGADGGDGFVRRSLPRAPRPPSPLPPITEPGELAALPRRAGWQELERWLHAVVRFHAEDPETLRIALKPVTGEPSSLYKEREWEHPGQWAEAIARQLADPGAEPPPRARPTPTPAVFSAAGGGIGAGGRVSRAEAGGEGGVSLRRQDRLPDASRVSAPHGMLLRRLAELHAAARAGALPPCLLATPTTGAGGIDPASLTDRLAGYERAGVEALPADLQQALLRLPRDIDPETMARAGRLRSEAGATTAAWMRHRPTPTTGIDWRMAGEDREPSLIPRIRSQPTGLELIDRLLSDPRASRWQSDGDDPAGWPAVLPHDREIAALHLLPRLLCRTHGSHVRPAEVRAVAQAGGPAGEAVALLVAYFLLHGEWRRDDGVRPLLDLAARGDLPAVETGRQLGLLLRRTWHQPPAMREALETVARSGAHVEVWRMLTGFLPVYLPGPGERAHKGHTQMLAFAVGAARWAGAHGALPCVAEIAARKATSAFVREARRLHASLT